MTDSEKLLLFALEAALPHQVEALLSIAGNKGVPLAELVTTGLAENLAALSEEGRLWAKQEVLKLGSDVENLCIESKRRAWQGSFSHLTHKPTTIASCLPTCGPSSSRPGGHAYWAPKHSPD